MSPRFERRPDKGAGAGGRKPGRPGSSYSPYRDRDKGRDRPSDRGRPPERATDRERGPARSVDRDRPPAREWDRSRDSRRDARREPLRGGGGGSERGSYPRRSAAPERSGPPRREDSRRTSDGTRPRRLLPSRFSRPPVVAVERRPVEPPQGLHMDESPASDLIWGRHVAQAALESGRPVHRIWCTAEMRFSPAFLQLLREAKASGVLVEEVTWARLGQITGGALHQGIVLQAAAADTLDLSSLVEGCRELGEPPLLMALDGITDPHNLGAIARSAEALGAHGLVLPQRRSAGLTGSVAKVAAGALEHLPVARVVNLNRALDTLKQEGYRVVGLAAEGTLSLEQVDLDGPLVIVTGSEGDGLSMLTRKHCDQLVSIPLRGATPSLNASVATALLLYEVARRGWMKGLRGGDPAPRIVRPQLPNAAAEPPAAPDSDFEPAPAPAFPAAAEPDPTPQPEPPLPVVAAEEPAPEPAPEQPGEPDVEPEVEPVAAWALEAESEAETEPKPEPELDLEPQAEPGSETQPESVLEPEPEPAAEPSFAIGKASPSLTGFEGDVQL